MKKLTRMGKFADHKNFACTQITVSESELKFSENTLGNLSPFLILWIAYSIVTFHSCLMFVGFMYLRLNISKDSVSMLIIYSFRANIAYQIFLNKDRSKIDAQDCLSLKKKKQQKRTSSYFKIFFCRYKNIHSCT